MAELFDDDEEEYEEEEIWVSGLAEVKELAEMQGFMIDMTDYMDPKEQWKTHGEAVGYVNATHPNFPGRTFTVTWGPDGWECTVEPGWGGGSEGLEAPDWREILTSAQNIEDE